MTDLIDEYQQTAKRLLEKKKQLQKELLSARGEKAFQLERRIDCISGMYLDTCYAIREMTKSMKREEELSCRAVNRQKEFYS